jgi:hypothetical protein
MIRIAVVESCTWVERYGKTIEVESGSGKT